jgi:hypothetical protein
MTMKNNGFIASLIKIRDKDYMCYDSFHAKQTWRAGDDYLPYYYTIFKPWKLIKTQANDNNPSQTGGLYETT